MLKYKTDKIIEGTPNTIYIHLYDDAEPSKILINMCIEYDTTETFEKELERKTLKYLESITARQTLSSSLASSFAKVESIIDIAKSKIEEKIL